MAKGKYKGKRLNKIRKEIKLISTELPAKIAKVLVTANVFNLYDFESCSEEQLKRLSGIGGE